MNIFLKNLITNSDFKSQQKMIFYSIYIYILIKK